MKKRFLVLLLVILLISCNCITAFSAEKKLISSNDTYSKKPVLKQSVYYLNKPDTKLPVVFLAHNGGQDGTAWGDFPQQIAKAGFFTVNITYGYESDVKSAIDYTLKKYKDKIDTKNVSFVGGCHGALMLSQVFMEGSSKYSVVNFVMLSLSESNDNFFTGDHPPILAYYSKNDEYGANYTDITKGIVEKLSKPRKIVANTDPAHGDNMVVKAKNKDQIRKNIIKWLKKYIKQ